jgi:serine/threonine protein kinase
MNRQTLPEGTLLRNGTYKIIRSLSSGGFGNTYVVENTNFNETFAMKEFFMKGVNSRNGTSVIVSQSDNEEVFQSQKEKFKKEAQRLRKLSHPSIVKIHDLFEENDTCYYVMDYIDGESLATKNTMTEQEALNVLKSVLDVLSVVHGLGFTHMDIKPANIMMSHDGRVYLIDFGASKLITTTERNTLSTATAMSYTKDYAPIEQVNEEFDHIGPATDFYALGATLYKLLTSNQPPSSSSIIEQGCEAFAFPDNISESTKSLVFWMMQPGRKKRPQSVREIQDYLNLHTENVVLPSSSSSATVLHVEKNKQKDFSKIWLLTFLLLLAIGAGLWFLIKTPPIEAEEAIESPEEVNEIDMPYAYGEAEETIESPKEVNEIDNPYYYVGKVTFGMKLINGGEFWMGSEYGQPEEQPVHYVWLRDYYIGETEVTQALWEEVMGSNPSEHVGRNLPIENVSYDDCQVFLNRLYDYTGFKFRLPTEAEWEFAARGGNFSQNYAYAGSDNAEEVGWIRTNSSETMPVAQKLPNELGLYDMTGNVCEWCQDWFASYDEEAQNNPKGPTNGTARVGRGGGWCNSAARNRVVSRNSGRPDYKDHNLGLRLALDY